ncbi:MULTISPECIES: hypothetical protein [unclassified Spirillospora]|uniref:hypothetical protein n=1 Tax=unclassified Spirillospora TaxID=2642701 RepID=UPI00372222B8
MLFALDETASPPGLRYPYFETAEPVISEEPGTYVQTETMFTHTLTHEWNHGLGETITALLAAGMRVTGLTEHDSVPWHALPGHMTMDETGEWRLSRHPERLAASYTLQAVKE